MKLRTLLLASAMTIGFGTATLAQDPAASGAATTPDSDMSAPAGEMSTTSTAPATAPVAKMSGDTDKDGRLSRDEANVAYGNSFVRLDKDSDGFVTAQERNLAEGAKLSGDTDKDGRLSKDEFMAASQKGFDRRDVNKDGFLTQEERSAKLTSSTAAKTDMTTEDTTEEPTEKSWLQRLFGR